MKLVDGRDPILKEPTQKFDFADPPFDPIEFAQGLVKTMIDSNGIGLAANQVGVPYQICAIIGEPNRVMFNPKIVSFSDEEISLDEGCLTFPGMLVKIKRPKHIKVRYAQPNGNVLTETFTGMTARIIQHEVDHLNGVLFYNRAGRYHREKAMKEWELYKRRGAGFATATSRSQSILTPSFGDLNSISSTIQAS